MFQWIPSLCFPGTFAPESDKVIYGLVFPIRTFEIIHVQVSPVVGAATPPTPRHRNSAVGGAAQLRPPKGKHFGQMRRELVFPRWLRGRFVTITLLLPSKQTGQLRSEGAAQWDARTRTFWLFLLPSVGTAQSKHLICFFHFTLLIFHLFDLLVFFLNVIYCWGAAGQAPGGGQVVTEW